MGPTRLVLASGSPRRRALVASLGIDPEIVGPDIDERPLPSEEPLAHVARLSAAKARAVGPRQGAVTLAADTIVALDGRILGKPADADAAGRMLRDLSGRTHEVHSGVSALTTREQQTIVVTTVVHLAALSDEEISWYVSTGEPLDKAGAYAIQGAGGAYVTRIEGSASNVVGLPLAETVELLASVGVRVRDLRP